MSVGVYMRIRHAFMLVCMRFVVFLCYELEYVYVCTCMYVRAYVHIRIIACMYVHICVHASCMHI